MRSSPPKGRFDALKILIVTGELPYPPVRGGVIRTFNFIKRLSARGHEIALLSLATEEEERYVDILGNFCKKIMLVKRTPGRRGLIKNLDPNMVKALHAMGDQFDVAHFERTHMGSYGWCLNAKVKKVLVEQDLVWLTTWQLARSSRLSLSRIKEYLRAASILFADISICYNFDAVICVSDWDAKLLNFFVRRKIPVQVVTNGIDLEDNRFIDNLGEQRNLIFCGDFRHPPNVEAILYFAHEIFPLIKTESKEIKLFIVGGMPPKEVQDLGKIEGISMLGLVENLDAIYRSCMVSVAPIKSGCGTRIKILEAMAKGLPVVSTSIGCRGLKVSRGEHLLIADSPNDFAASILKLVEDEALRGRLRENARRLVEDQYNYDKLVSSLERVYFKITGRLCDEHII